MGKLTPPGAFHPLERRARKTIQNHDMLAAGEHVLVAVSGGADSVALLHCLVALSSEYDLRLTVAHLNHRIRGKAADADADFVRRMSLELGLPFVGATVEVKRQAELTGRNLEEHARGVRYGFLRAAARRAGAGKIAVGHNRNDQAETALFRFLRGSGIAGLAAIRPVVDDLVIRPLLDCGRGLILDYLERRAIGYREDASNNDLRYARNRLRHETIPCLEHGFNPRLVPTLARQARMAGEAWDYIRTQAVRALSGILSSAGEGRALAIPALMGLHPALRKEVVRQALLESLGSLRGIGSVHVEGILSLCARRKGDGQVQLPHGGRAVRQFDTLTLLGRPPAEAPAYTHPLPVPGQCVIAQTGVTLRASTCLAPDPASRKLPSHPQAFLDASTLPGPLTVRSRIPGDRYGGEGRRKVKRMLIDARIPRLERARLPMVVSGDAVVWIPGFRPSRRHEAEPGTPCILVEMLPAPESERCAE
jgi:tRNA(Ile)-lysidine synthase